MAETNAINIVQFLTFAPILAAIGIVSIVIASILRIKSALIYKNRLCKKLRKVKQLQKAYNKCYDPEKQDKIEKKYLKARKSLEKLMDKLIKHNNNINTRNPELEKQENISINSKEPITFSQLFQYKVDEYNRTHKKRVVTLNGPKKRKKAAKKQKTITPRSFSEKEINKLTPKPVETNNQEQTNKVNNKPNNVVYQSSLFVEDEIDLLP